MASHWMRRGFVAAACASAALLAACGSSTVESAISPNRVIAFGDAFSDVGQKGSAYTVNDGTVLNWTSQFAARYGKTVTPSSSGGTNYAYGNARLSASPDVAGEASTPTISAQIDSFLLTQKFNSNDVVTINGGISDLIYGFNNVQAGIITPAEYQTAARLWGTALGDMVRRLVNAGATHVVVSGVYNLGKSPWGASTGQQDLLYQANKQFNEGLNIAIVDLGRNVQYMDLEYYANLFVDSPGSFGFNNSNTPVCTSVDAGNGIGTGTGKLNSALCTQNTLLTGADQTKYLFADQVYFTPSAHRQFGDYTYDKVRLRW